MWGGGGKKYAILNMSANILYYRTSSPPAQRWSIETGTIKDTPFLYV